MAGSPAVRPDRSRAAAAIRLIPVVGVGGVALWGRLSPVDALGHLDTAVASALGALAVLYLVVWMTWPGWGLRKRTRTNGRIARPEPQSFAAKAVSLPVSHSDAAMVAPVNPNLAPVRAPAPPTTAAAAVITAVPGRPQRPDALPSWQERTQVPAHRQPGQSISASDPVRPEPMPAHQQTALPTARWAVVLDDGRTVPLDKPAVFGRDPAALPGEADTELRPIADETRTVSKTHVKLDPGTDSVLVTDRHSTNGVVVITAGVATRCRAGEPMVATQGSVVRFGDREMQVRRQ